MFSEQYWVKHPLVGTKGSSFENKLNTGNSSLCTSKMSRPVLGGAKEANLVKDSDFETIIWKSRITIRIPNFITLVPNVTVLWRTVEKKKFHQFIFVEVVATDWLPLKTYGVMSKWDIAIFIAFSWFPPTHLYPCWSLEGRLIWINALRRGQREC